MTLDLATRYAEQICEWLSEASQLVVIAGSIRRRRGECADVDIVCIPTVSEERDLVGDVVSRRNQVFEQLQRHAQEGHARILAGGIEGKQTIVALKKCQLDVYYATPETLASRLLCRTGSKEHNAWLAGEAKRQGKKWKPYEGVCVEGEWRALGEGRDEYAGGRVLPAATEAEIYTQLNLDYIEPWKRER
jgi:DNA polymerase/3'-5' exonuclease PolX